MNKKLIASAVVGTLAAPAVYADGHLGITPYGRVNNAIEFSDASGDDNVDVSNVSSRFGFKGAGDIGNGLTAVGRYEFATVADKEQPGIADIRLAFVGLSGGFGSVTIGNQWSAYFNHFGTIASPTFSLGFYLYSSFAGGPFRTSNTIKYANSFGPVSLDLDVRLNDQEEDSDVAEKINGNGVGLGVTYSPTDSISLAISLDTEENNDSVSVDEITGVETVSSTGDTDRFGIAGNFGLGIAKLSLAYQELENDGGTEFEHFQAYLKFALGGKTNLLLGAGTAEETTSGDEADSTFLGVYHKLGGGLQLYIESTSVDIDNGADFTQTFLGMRIDF